MIQRFSARVFTTVFAAALTALFDSSPAQSQVPFDGEVRQIVTFSLLPGKSGDALSIYRDQAIPLYEKDAAMRSFRGYREVESPIALDLMVVSSFEGMAGMDAHNSGLRALAAEAGTSIGAIYGGISAFSSGHTDQFVKMVPRLGSGDASSTRLTAFVWFQVAPGASDKFEARLALLADWESERGVQASTGKFMVSDGWHYLRFIGFDSLGDFQSYWEEAAGFGLDRLDEITVRRREIIVASDPRLSVR